LTIRIWSPKEYDRVQEISSDVDISFCNLWSSLDVSGHNESWVIGTHTKLFRFFAMSASASTVSIWTRKLAGVLKTDLAMSSLTGMSVVGLFGVINSVGLAYGTLFAVSVVYLLIKYLTWAKTYAPARARIELGERHNAWFLGIAPVDMVQLLLAILGVALSLLQLVIR